MSYKGFMNGWHGDEYECNGYCGVCDACEEAKSQFADQEYEAYRQEQLDGCYND